MSDLETGGLAGGSGGAPGAALGAGGEGGRAGGSSRRAGEASGADERGARPRADAEDSGSEDWSDERSDADLDADGALDDERDGDDEADDDPRELRRQIEALRREAAEAQERIKRMQGPHQQAVERAQRAEEVVYRQAYQAELNRHQQRFYREDADFNATMAQAQYALQLARAQGNRAQFDALIREMADAQRRFDQQRRDDLREVHFKAREAHLAYQQEQLRPLQREKVVADVDRYYREKHGMRIPKHVTQHAETEREAWLAAYTWADTQRHREDRRRGERLEQDAQAVDRTPPARGGGENKAALRAQLKALEGSGNLYESYELRKRLGLIKTERVRTS